MQWCVMAIKVEKHGRKDDLLSKDTYEESENEHALRFSIMYCTHTNSVQCSVKTTYKIIILFRTSLDGGSSVTSNGSS